MGYKFNSQSNTIVITISLSLSLSVDPTPPQCLSHPPKKKKLKK